MYDEHYLHKDGLYSPRTATLLPWYSSVLVNKKYDILKGACSGDGIDWFGLGR